MYKRQEEGNQVGIGKENGNGGLSITIPNWNSDNRGYTVKVQAKNGSTVNPDAEYHLSFQTKQADKSHGAYQEMAEVQKYEGTVRKQMQELSLIHILKYLKFQCTPQEQASQYLLQFQRRVLKLSLIHIYYGDGVYAEDA